MPAPSDAAALDALTAEMRAGVQRGWAGVDACFEGSVGPVEGAEGGDEAPSAFEWKEGGKEAVRDLLVSNLAAISPDAGTESPALLVLHYTLALLLDSGLPAAAITELLRELESDPHVQVLQEAVVDVLETRVDLELDVKAGENAEGGGAAGAAGVTERAAEILRSLLQLSFLPPLLTACLLDPLRLPSTSTTSLTPAKLTQLERRRRTALCFRQNKYNLLREASEGWAGLVVLLSHPGVLGPEETGEEGAEVDAERRTRAARAWREIMRLIGAYDLSPPRVLDVIIDTACVHLATHHRFFLALLEASPWTEQDMGVDESETADLRGESVLRSWRFAEQIKRERGCRMLTQVLGFKYGFYQETSRDLKGIERRVDATPKDLLLFTAIVMKRGWVRMVDIMPYLGPDDKVMNTLARKFKSDTQAKISGLSGNALSAAGALADDDAPASSSTAEADKPAVEAAPVVHVEQKVLLVQALLSVGHWAPALAMLARWPVIAHYHPAVSDILLRIVRIMIEPAYRPLEADLAIASEGSGLAPARPSATEDLPKKQQSTLVLPQPLDTSRTAFRYFYPQWLEDLPICTDASEVAERVRPFMRLVGPLGARDVQVLVWLCRIGIQQRHQDPSDDVTHMWTDIIRCTLLPSLPLLDCNVGYNNELWPLIQPFPYDFRYALYGEWDVALSERLSKTYSPAMALAAAQSHVNVRSTLRRVTAGNERVAARALGKASTAAPTMLWTALLDQIKSYPNMIPSLAKAVSRYGSDLGWDVAMYMLLKTLSDTGRDRVKEDGLHAADWLQAVSTFVGVLSRSTDKLHLEPLLQLFANQLKAKSLADLVALQTLIYEMTGIEALHNISDTQVACFSGGPILTDEGSQATRIEHPEPPRADADRAAQLKMDKRPERKLQYEKPTQRLISALVGSGLAQPILIAIAQLRKSSVFTATSTARHTKQLSLKFDECDAIFQQYIRLLYAGMLADEQAYKHVLPIFLPPLRAMQHDFGLDLAASFQLLRPKLYWQIHVNREEVLRLQLRRQHYRKDLTEEERMQTNLIQWNESAIIPALLPVVVDVASCLDANIRHYQLEPFISSFWQLSLGELEVPEKTYSEIISRLQGMSNQLAEWSKPGVALNRYWVDAYRGNREHMLRRADSLTKELAVQKLYFEATKKRLGSEMNQWFTGTNQPSLEDPQPLKRKDFAALLHNTCFYPRAIVSIRDATFVAKFVRYLHDWNAERFSLLAVYEHFFDTKLGACLFACTETESASLGRFLNYLLVDAERWRRDEAAFNTEAIGPNPDKANVPLDGMKLSAARFVDWGSFKRLCRKWHNRILTAISTCLQSPDYMHIKNGITVALRLLPHFPKQKSMYEAFKKALTAFQEKEAGRPDKREDLELAAKSLQSAIEIAARNPDFVVANDDFSPPPPGAKPAANGSSMKRSTSANNAVNGSLAAKAEANGAQVPITTSLPATPKEVEKEEPAAALSQEVLASEPPPPDLAALRDQLAKSRAEKLRLASANGSADQSADLVVSQQNDRGSGPAIPTGPRSNASQEARSRPDSRAQISDDASGRANAQPRIRDSVGQDNATDRQRTPLRNSSGRESESRREVEPKELLREEPRNGPAKSEMPPPETARDPRREPDDLHRDRNRPSEQPDRPRTRSGRHDDDTREHTPPRDGRRTSPARRPGSRAHSVESRASRTSERRRHERDRDGDKRDSHDRSSRSHREPRDRDDRRDRGDRRERDRASRSSKDAEGGAEREHDRERRRTRDREDRDRRDRHRSDRPAEPAPLDRRPADVDRAESDRTPRERDARRQSEHDRHRERDGRDRPAESDARSRHDRRGDAPRSEPPRSEPARAEPSAPGPPRAPATRAEPPRAPASRADPPGEPTRGDASRAEASRSNRQSADTARPENARGPPQDAAPARTAPLQGGRDREVPSSAPTRPRSPARSNEPARPAPPGGDESGRTRSLLERMSMPLGSAAPETRARSRNGESTPGRTSRPASPPRSGPRELLPSAPASTSANGNVGNASTGSPMGFQVNGRATRSSQPPASSPRNASLPARPGGQPPPMTPSGDRVTEMRGRDRDGAASPLGDGQGRKRPAEGSAREASATPRAEGPPTSASAPSERSPAASTPPLSAASATPTLPAKRPRLDREAANKRAQRTTEGEGDASGRQRGRLFDSLTGMKG